MKCCSGFSSFSVSFWPASSGRQLVFQFLVFFVFAFFGFFVDLQEAVEFQDRSGHAEPESFAATLRIDVDGRLIEDRGIDLRRDKALPDQFVNFELVFFQILLDLVRMPHR